MICSPKVYFISRILTHYRKPFHELVRKKLRACGVDYVVIYGNPSPNESKKMDTEDSSVGIKVKSYYSMIFGREVVYMAASKNVKNADLIILEQQSKQLHLYYFFIKRLLGGPSVAFWGHGKNFNHNTNFFSEYIKRFLSTKVDWWFAYNDLSKRIVESYGFPSDKISAVQNSIDLDPLIKHSNSITEERLEELRKELDIDNNDIGLFIGSLYPDKGLPFVIEAAKLIREKKPDFKLIIIGAGEDAGYVEESVQKFNFIKFVGPKFYLDKVIYFNLARVLLIPKAIGLVTLDSFALRTPIVTTNDPSHGPEFSYLINDFNCLVSKYDSIESYAETVIELLDNRKKHETLVEGCYNSSQEYSLEKMSTRFVEGVLSAIEVRCDV
jgi:glycosyltransferase involved in cell wall biosynthesis